MLNPDFRDILLEFAAEAVRYLLVGGYALAAHGHPRATGDIDLLVERSPENAVRVWRALARFGAPVDQLTVDDLQQPELVYQMGLPPWRIDILTSIDGVEFAQAWPGRLEARVDDLLVPVLGLADLIRNKRAAGRPKDLADLWVLERTIRSR